MLDRNSRSFETKEERIFVGQTVVARSVPTMYGTMRFALPSVTDGTGQGMLLTRKEIATVAHPRCTPSRADALMGRTASRSAAQGTLLRNDRKQIGTEVFNCKGAVWFG
jgi:hypothetical protein